MAIDAVKVGDAWGALYFTENFTDALVARMALGRESDDETLDQSEVRVWLDMSSEYNVRPILSVSHFVRYYFILTGILCILDQQIGLMLNRDLQLSYRDFGQALLKSCDQNPKLADIPIQVRLSAVMGSLRLYYADNLFKI